MTLVTVTTDDFETIAVRVSIDTASRLIGWGTSAAVRQDIEREGIACRGRFIIETAPHKSRRDGWIHEDFRSPYLPDFD